MAEATPRDRVWLETVETLLREIEDDGLPSVTPAGIAEARDVSERTARDCLKIMAANGLVEEDRIPDGRIRYVPVGLLAR